MWLTESGKLRERQMRRVELSASGGWYARGASGKLRERQMRERAADEVARGAETAGGRWAVVSRALEACWASEAAPWPRANAGLGWAQSSEQPKQRLARGCLRDMAAGGSGSRESWRAGRRGVRSGVGRRA